MVIMGTERHFRKTLEEEIEHMKKVLKLKDCILCGLPMFSAEVVHRTCLKAYKKGFSDACWDPNVPRDADADEEKDSAKSRKYLRLRLDVFSKELEQLRKELDAFTEVNFSR